MDKYQQYFIDEVAFPTELNRDRDKVQKNVYSVNSGEVCGEVDFENFIITVNQEEDIFSVKYKAVIKAYNRCLYLPFIYDAYITRDGKEWERLEERYENDEGKPYHAIYEIPLDFENKVTSVKLSFPDGIIGDLVFNVVYNEADKELYYKRKKESDLQELISRANLQWSSAFNMLNVYFTPCNGEDYGGSEITLYRDKDQFMAKYSSIAGVFCITVLGLGQGDYCFTYRQYDKKKKLLFETDRLYCKI